MPDGLALTISTLMGVLFWWLLFTVLRAERFARYVARWIHSWNRLFLVRVDRAARGLMLAVAGCTWLMTGLATFSLWLLASPQGLGNSRGWFFSAVAMWLAILVVFVVGVVAVALTGRPAMLVIKPCRGMSPTEINRWVRETADLPASWR